MNGREILHQLIGGQNMAKCHYFWGFNHPFGDAGCFPFTVGLWTTSEKWCNLIMTAENCKHLSALGSQSALLLKPFWPWHNWDRDIPCWGSNVLLELSSIILFCRKNLINYLDPHQFIEKRGSDQKCGYPLYVHSFIRVILVNTWSTHGQRA